MSGTSIPKASEMSRKWLTKDSRRVATAEEVPPLTADGLSATQEKLVAEVFSNGFSNTKVNSFSRYCAFAAKVVEGSISATKVMRRVLLAMRL